MVSNLFRKRFQFKNLNDEFSILKEKKTELYGLYNRKTQKFEIPLIYHYMDADFSKSKLILVQNNEGFFGYLNESNEIILPFQYEEASTFSYGIAYISKFVEENNLEIEYHGIIDENGKLILPIEYNSIYIYNEECVIIKKNNKYGIITLNKSIILPLEYDCIESFGWISEGFFKCYQNEKIGIFDITTQIYIIPVELDRIEYYLMNSHQEYHIFAKNGLEALVKIVNREIIFITDYIYEYIDQTEMPKNRLRAKKNGFFGVIDMNGNLIIPCEYQSIYYSNKKIEAIKGKKESIFDLDGHLISIL